MTSASHLEESLRILRSEIATLGSDDDATRQRLESVVEDIEARLARADGDDPDDSVTGGLKASIVSFEASHPRLAVLMNDVLEKLSAMGI